MKHQPRRRHQVEHRGHQLAIEPRRRLLAVLREAALVLRPQPVHHEGIGPRRRALLAAIAAALFAVLAERRRPGERQYVEVEFSWLLAASIPGPAVRQG